MWILTVQDITIIDLLNCNLWYMVWYCVRHRHIEEGWKTQKYGWLQLHPYRCWSKCDDLELNKNMGERSSTLMIKIKCVCVRTGIKLCGWRFRGLAPCKTCANAPGKLAKCSECHDISEDWSATLRNMHTMKHVQVGPMGLLLARWLGTTSAMA